MDSESLEQFEKYLATCKSTPMPKFNIGDKIYDPYCIGRSKDQFFELTVFKRFWRVDIQQWEYYRGVPSKYSPIVGWAGYTLESSAGKRRDFLFLT